MANLAICRVCLVDDLHMHVVISRQLQETYEKLTNTLFQAEGRPILACYICYARLKRCYLFKQKCLESEEVLTQMLTGNCKNHKRNQSTNTFNKTSVQQINIIDVPEGNTTVKIEVPISFERVDNVAMKKEENNEDINLQTNDRFSDFDELPSISDSEDDIPLTRIKSEAEEPVKKRIILKKKRVKDLGYLHANAIMLSKEQQVENMLARSKSLNYTASPFKCDLCFKGFVDTRAFQNHKMKHDVRSGTYICEICCLRYRTPQHLKSHTVNAHARIFKCGKCGHVSHTAHQSRVHEKWHNGHTYQCQLCSHNFKKPTSYLSHVRKRHPTEHVCDVCGDSFVGRHGLQMHKSKTHRNEEQPENSDEPASDRFCTDCDIQFCTLDAWKRHILSSVKHTLKNEHKPQLGANSVVTQPLSSQCMICGWQCARAGSLRAHLAEHARALRRRAGGRRAPDRQLRCQQCGANFVSRSKLQAHINRTHLGLKYNKNIVCEVCGKKCTSNATLKYHQRTHTGEKPYPCSSCNKHFSDSNQLRIHTRTHTGEKPYVCAACGKRFSQKPALNRHYRVHTGAKPYTCQYCSRTFSQSNSLKLHVKTVHLKQPANNRKNKTQMTDVTKSDEKNTQVMAV